MFVVNLMIPVTEDYITMITWMTVSGVTWGGHWQ